MCSRKQRKASVFSVTWYHLTYIQPMRAMLGVMNVRSSRLVALQSLRSSTSRMTSPPPVKYPLLLLTSRLAPTNFSCFKLHTLFVYVRQNNEDFFHCRTALNWFCNVKSARLCKRTDKPSEAETSKINYAR